MGTNEKPAVAGAHGRQIKKTDCATRDELDDRCLRTKHVREGRTHTTVLNRVRHKHDRYSFACGTKNDDVELLLKEVPMTTLQEYRTKFL